MNHLCCSASAETSRIPWAIRSRLCTLSALTIAIAAIGSLALPAGAQPNSWTSSASGSWETPNWSLGILPGPGQSIFITNAGWKAVMIGPTTAQNHPQSLTVERIAVASPVDSFNTLLLNHAGFQTPLTTKWLIVETNAAATLLSSWLHLNGTSGSGLSVGGTFDHDENSLVTGIQMDVGYIGPGPYYLRSGEISLQHLWVGSGSFEQSGGINTNGILHLDGGLYHLSGGEFGAELYLNYGTFRQTGGRVIRTLELYRGSYLLDGGIQSADSIVPITAFETAGGSASMFQSGGTNLGSLQIGYMGYGSYVMSNGVSIAPGISVGPRGSFHQEDGSQSIAGTFAINEGWINRNDIGWGFAALNGGMLSSSSMFLSGRYTQSGGTNTVTNTFTMAGTHGAATLYGGELSCQNLDIQPSWVGYFRQFGSRLIVSNTLSARGNDLPLWEGLYFSGGEVIVSNIFLSGNLRFFKGGACNLQQSGQLTLAVANLILGAGSHQFGPLQLAGFGSVTNSFVTLPQSGACTIHFGDSSGITWSNAALLTVSNWNGSIFGNGTHQISFGADAGGLTPAQLDRIRFINPAGAPGGLYTAKILASGEVVPDYLPPTSRIPPELSLILNPEGSLQLGVRGDIGASYEIQVSSNLSDWVTWTNCQTPEGVAFVIDQVAPDCPIRFYRAFLLP